MSNIDDIFSDPPETVTLEIKLPSDLYADLAGAVASNDDPPRALIDVEELIALIVQEAWADAEETTPWFKRVNDRISD